MTPFERAAAGMAQVDVPDLVRDRALRHLQRWCSGAPFAPYRDAIAALAEGGRFEELVDAFRQVLPFGTGGRRGFVGVGPNRINPFTVATSVEGHVRWLRGTFPNAGLRVVVAYDVRRFVDVRGVYGGRAGALHGLSSRDLAELAARVYAGNGVEVHLLPRGAPYLLSTPELSFTIRVLHAHGGLNISASHNPPDDNGVKVYDQRGGQLAPPADQDLLDVVSAVEDATVPAWEDAVASGLVRWLPPELHRGYVDTVAGLAPPGPRAVEVLYTPLHGTGAVGEVLGAAGFRCRVHAAQAAPDGAFPTVPGGVANPEQPEAMAHALAAAGAEIDLVLGTDPDADRIGAEVRHAGRWVHLTGNDIAALVVTAALRRDVAPRRPLVVLTEVTSALVGRVARAGGAVVVDDLLVGFKYVADVLRALEEEGRYGDLDAREVAFVCGAEESHGVLVTEKMRDKDAAGGAVLLAAIAAQAKVAGRTLVDVLDDLRAAHGHVRNTQVSLQYPGATGQQRLSDLLDGLRARPPLRIGLRDVATAVDHRDPAGRFGAFRSESDRVARNVLVYGLVRGEHDEGGRVILRPSGTEPKLKVYLELTGLPGLGAASRDAVDADLAALGDAVRQWLG